VEHRQKGTIILDIIVTITCKSTYFFLFCFDAELIVLLLHSPVWKKNPIINLNNFLNSYSNINCYKYCKM